MRIKIKTLFPLILILSVCSVWAYLQYQTLDFSGTTDQGQNNIGASNVNYTAWSFNVTSSFVLKTVQVYFSQIYNNSGPGGDSNFGQRTGSFQVGIVPGNLSTPNTTIPIEWSNNSILFDSSLVPGYYNFTFTPSNITINANSNYFVVVNYSNCTNGGNRFIRVAENTNAGMHYVWWGSTENFTNNGLTLSSASPENVNIRLFGMNIISLNIVQPTNSTFNTKTNLTYLVTAAAGLGSCWYMLNSGANITITCGTNATGLNVSQGSNTLYLYMNDTIGNLASDNVNFSVDSVLPIVNFTAPTPNNNTLSTNSSLTLNISITELNFANLTYWVYNTTALFNKTFYSILTTNISYSNLPEGTYYYNVSVFDTANNQNWTETRTYDYAVNPNITINSPTGTQSSKTFTVNISFADNTDLSYCYFNITRGASVEVANTAYVTCNTTVSVTVSSDATYVLWAFANDTFNNINITNMTFTVLTASGNGGGGGGGGGAQPINITALVQNSLTSKTAKLCEPLLPIVEDAYSVWQADKTSDNFIKLWYAFWNHVFCRSSASIVPL